MRRLIIAAVAVSIAIGAITGCACSNPETPAGYAGYVTRGAIVGKTSYVGVQHGPTSTGLGWLLRTTNVSITPYTYTEDFTGKDAVLSRDNLAIEFRVHAVWKIRRDDEQIKLFVERFSILEQSTNADKVAEIAYGNFLREPLRTAARDEVQRRDGLKVKEEITVIGAALKARADAITAETPFEIMSIVVGNIQYPKAIADAVAEKLATTQQLERQQTLIEIERKKKEQRVVEAEGIAAAMQIVRSQLTGAYLQHEAIEAQKAMVNSPNHTTIYIPIGANGVPIVGALDLSPPRVLKPAAVAAQE